MKSIYEILGRFEFYVSLQFFVTLLAPTKS